MKVWLITIGEILPIKEGARKGRTSHLADALVKRGHSVLWWTSAFDHFKKEWISQKNATINLNENFTIKLMRGLGYKKNFSFSRFVDHKLLATKFKKLLKKEEKPDIIVASLPSYELAHEATIFAKKNKIPIIIDVRDEWPDIFFEFIPHWMHSIVKVILWRDFKVVKNCLQKCTHITSMIKSSLGWALTIAERDKTPDDRIFYLGAKKIAKPLVAESKLSYIEKDAKGKFVVSFVGNFNEFYNPIILIEAAKILSKLDIYFILGGDGIYYNKAKELSGGLKNVALTGWLSNPDIAYVLSFSHVGIIPCFKKIEAFPNKAFTYFSAGLPVISSVEGGLKEIIKKNNMGLYYPAGSATELADRIKSMYENRILCEEMSKNANRVFDEIFDAEKIYKDYAEYLEYIWKKEKK